MDSTYLAGVFLTICTYDGPQLVYHWYDQRYAKGLDHHPPSDESEFDWSDNESEVDSVSSSPASSRMSPTAASPLVDAMGATPSAVPIGSISSWRSSPFLAHSSSHSGDKDQHGSSHRSDQSGLTHHSYRSGMSTQSSATNSGESRDRTPEHVPESEPALESGLQEERFDASFPVGLDAEIIAELLSPPESMCNERFSLTVENCMFIGIPIHILDSGTWRPLKNGADLNGVVTEADSPMRMFHLCFAILPPINDARDCEERLYRSVIVPFVRTLRQEQASKNYVWEQVSLILKAQEATANRSLAERQLAVESASELAASLHKTCWAISRMEIARVMLAGKPRAFQVPLQLEMTHLPAWYVKVSPHAYVNTSNSSDKEITHDVYTCYGLLLLDTPETIIEEIDVDAQGPIAAMIRSIDPTASLAELSEQNNIEIGQLVNLVWSLVYWRRARIIIPLHARYTYGISPLSPETARYTALARAFHTNFPMMPAIQKFLALLSNGKPRPFAVHIPTDDHRHIYMQALAWLLQNDFIVHLPTFVLISVPRKIKLAAYNSESAVDDEFRYLEDTRDTMILDPRRATAVEKRWLNQIMLTGATRNPDQAALFSRLTKYFNGKDCLEQVMIHEKISREDMRAFLQEFGKYIVTYKHW